MPPRLSTKGPWRPSYMRIRLARAPLRRLSDQDRGRAADARLRAFRLQQARLRAFRLRESFALQQARESSPAVHPRSRSRSRSPAVLEAEAAAAAPLPLAHEGPSSSRPTPRGTVGLELASA